METGDKLFEIINHYGVIPQLRQFNEECFELIEAIYEHEFEQVSNKEHIIEEIADVFVMLEQFIVYYDIDYKKEIMPIEDFKIERQLGRINNDE